MVDSGKGGKAPGYSVDFFDSFDFCFISKMFARVTFLPSLAYNCAMERVSARQWWDRIEPQILLGAIPFRSDWMALNLGMNMTTEQMVEAEGVRGVVSMNEDYELQLMGMQQEAWKKLGVKFLQLETTDIFSAPSQAKLRTGVGFMKEVVESGSSVYVHCKAGRTRSATLVAAYLIAEQGLKPEEAVSKMREVRPHILLHSPQWAALKEFHQGVQQQSSETD